MSDKKLTDQQLLGEQGIASISLAVSRMGYVWRPTSQHDTGIDGEIEIRDSASGIVSGLIIKVQSKAVTNLDNETHEGFDYWPNQRDVTYWLGHNVPVILIVSRPTTNEVYWQSVEMPSGPTARKKFHFIKTRDGLNEQAKGRLAELVKSGAPGAKGFALAKSETLVSNLLPVVKLPNRLFLAETKFKTPREVWGAFNDNHLPFEFVLKNKRILTVRDLTDPHYEFLCDRGTVEDFPVSEWADSSDVDKQRDFVNLLNRCLERFLRASIGHLRFDKTNGAFFFPANMENVPYAYGYRGQKKSTTRVVVRRLINKKEGHVMGFRHSAMSARFFRYERLWYLEVTPTYVFTQPNGVTSSQYHPKWLAGIKKLERNSAVLGQLVMWEELLAGSDDLLSEPYPFLGFGRTVNFQTAHGIDDDAWGASAHAESLPLDEQFAGLF